MSGVALMLAAICLNVTCGDMSVISELSVNETNSIRNSSTNLMVRQNSTQEKQERIRELKEALNGRDLKIVTLEDYPLSYTEENKNGALKLKGVACKILEFLTKKFNFTYTVTKANIIGSKSDANNNSIVEFLRNNSTDMAAAFIPLLANTHSLITYSTTTLDEGEWIMIMQRPAGSGSTSGLLAPFASEVWYLILVSLLAVGPIIYGLIVLRHKLTKDNAQKTYPLPHCVWFVYGALMKQGSTLSPVADSTRLIFATWWIFITILTSFYTANLTAFLTLSKITLPIKEVNDIFRKDKQFVSIRGGCVEYAIKNDNESLSYLWPMVTKDRAQFKSEEREIDFLNKYVEKKDFVFVRDRPAIDHLIYKDYKSRQERGVTDEKKQCPFVTSKIPFLKRKRAFAYPPNTNWSYLFDPELLHLVESGIIKYMLQEKLPNTEICPQDLGGTERQLRNNDLKMTYQIMLAGFCTAVIVFFTEVICKYLNARLHYRDTNLQIHQSFRNKLNKSNVNVTPPPSYATLFNRSRNKVWTSDSLTKSVDSSGGVQQYINGRNYMVFKNEEGEPRLVPLRTPSAALFQYAYTK